MQQINMQRKNTLFPYYICYVQNTNFATNDKKKFFKSQRK